MRRRKDIETFYLVRDTMLSSKPDYILFNSEPHLYEINGNGWYKDHSYNGSRWYSAHGDCYLNRDKCGKFSDVKFEPVMVRLRVCNDGEEPDMFIQRVADNLFISSRKMSVTRSRPRTGSKFKSLLLGKYKFSEEEEVPHINRISNNLFPDVTEESGIVGVVIERMPR